MEKSTETNQKAPVSCNCLMIRWEEDHENTTNRALTGAPLKTSQHAFGLSIWEVRNKGGAVVSEVGYLRLVS